MRFPWQRRADVEKDHRLAAEQQLAEARSDWVTVHTHVNQLRREQAMNGWTGIVATLFADNGKASR